MAGLAALRLEIDEGRRSALLRYLRLLEKWNRVYALSGVREPEAMLARHLLDCLAILPYLAGHRFLDLGSGAGLPGMVLALAEPSHRWVLLEPNARKVRFLTQVLIELQPGGIEVVHSRAEAYRPEQRFDTIVTRAVAALTMVVRWAAPLMAPGGRLLVMKGRYPREEIAALDASVPAPRVQRLAVPGLVSERHLIQIDWRGAEAKAPR